MTALVGFGAAGCVFALVPKVLLGSLILGGGGLVTHPALEMAEERQAVAQGGSLPRIWAVERVRRVVKVKKFSFIIVVVVVAVVIAMVID